MQEYKLVLSELKRLKEIENDLERIVSTGLSPKNQLEESEENKESVEPIDSFYDQLSYRYLWHSDGQDVQFLKIYQVKTVEICTSCPSLPLTKKKKKNLIKLKKKSFISHLFSFWFSI